MRRRRITLSLAAGYVIVLAYIALWPTPVDQPVDGILGEVLGWLHGHGLPEWVGYNAVEFSANIALFIPLAFFIETVRRTRMATVIAIGVASSATIELLQALFSPQRFSTPRDILANTIGTVLGVVALSILNAKPKSLNDLQDRQKTGNRY